MITDLYDAVQGMYEWFVNHSEEAHAYMESLGNKNIGVINDDAHEEIMHLLTVKFADRDWLEGVVLDAFSANDAYGVDFNHCVTNREYDILVLGNMLSEYILECGRLYDSI